jgi:hypothetical protein
MPFRRGHLASRTLGIGLAGALLFVFDRAVLGAGTSPLGLAGMVGLWSFHVSTAQAFALAGVLWIGLLRICGRFRRLQVGEGQPVIAGLMLSLVAAAPLYWIAEALTSGDWISRQSYALALKVGAVTAGMVALVVLGWLVARDDVNNPAIVATARWRVALTALLLVGATVTAIVDAQWLTGLYRALHLLLYGLCTLLTLLAATRIVDHGLALWPRARSWVGVVGTALLLVALACAALLVPARRSAIALGSRQAALVLPFVLAEVATTVRDELRRMNLVVDVAPTRRDSSAATDRLLGGRRDYNVLLLVMDALRADAVPPGRGNGRRFADAADTPFLDDWLARSFRFRTAYSQASCTHPSLSPTFRSLEVSDDVEHVGIPLGVQAADLKMVPVAVVPPYIESDASDLLVGFQRVSVYQKDRQHSVVDRVHDLFEGLAGQRFFAWVHFYCLHSPYFAGKATTKADGSVSKRYRSALRWLDGQTRRLIAELEQAGLAENTVIIFTADHGENLGEDGRKGHGGTVSEIEVHVPLAVYIPGQVGGDINTIVGNVDIVPTVLDIAGAPANPTHRGRSLLPILAGVENETIPLYFENSKGTEQGVTIGRNKLVRRGSGMLYRYDTAADPAETHDLYHPGGKIDDALESALLRKNPALFAEELASAETRGLLVRRLSEVVLEAQAGPDLELLLRLAALSKDPGVLAQAERILTQAHDVTVRLLAVRYLHETDTAR